MNERTLGKLQRLNVNRVAVPTEFWLKTADVEFRNRRERTGRTAPRNAPPVPTEFEVIWLLTEEGRRDNSVMFEQREDLPTPFMDVRRCFVRFGIERMQGKIVWGYRYSMAMEPPTNVYHCFDSINEWKELERSKGSKTDWVDEVDKTADEWLLVIDGAMGKEIDATKILQVRNMEMRRYLIKKIGYDVIKSKLPGFRVISRVDKINAELFEIVLPDDTDRAGRRMRDRQMRYVKVVDSSTDREYILSVPPTASSVHEGLAYGFDVRAENYRPIVET